MQTTFRLGERITQKFTKDNPAAWCNYFDQICFRYNILSNDDKIHALISCLDADSLAMVQPILGPNVPYAQVKQLLLDTYTAPLDARLQDILNVSSLGDLKPSQFLARARARISKNDMSDSVLIEILVAKLSYEAQIALATIVGMPLKDFAAAAHAAVRRLPPSFISSVSEP